ncbi:MAG: SDR family NAD(P)-dependent oxidoreductase [bacterium]|nr:SDR family NAD(P)-dependent oxidoreductase [bacterium]
MSKIKHASNYKNLVEVIRARQGNTKGILFVKNKENETFLSYDALYKEALQLLHAFQAKGLEPGDELVFQVEDNYDFVRIFWACLLGKIVPVPVTMASNDEYRLKLFNIWKILKKPHLITSKKHLVNLTTNVTANSKDFVSGKDRKELSDTIRTNTLILEGIETTGETGVIHFPDESDIAFIQFSSGSTGDPKGVVLTHKNLLANTNDILIAMHGQPDDKMLSWMPLTHDMGIIGFHLVPMMADWEHVLMPPQLFVRYPAFWLWKVMETESTVTVSPNFGYKYLLKHFKPEKFAGLNLSSVRLIVNGAEPICAELCCEFLDLLEPFGLKRQAMFPVYGLAEASLAVSFSIPEAKIVIDDFDRHSLKIGEKVKETDDKTNAISLVEVGETVDKCFLKLVDEKDGTVRDGIIGNILIKGDNVTQGYYNNKEENFRVFTADGWLRTGDLGFKKDGRLYITGRTKDIIFVNGQNYYSHDIERLGEELEGIGFEKVAVCGAFNVLHKANQVIAFVAFKRKIKDFLPLANQLRQHILEKAGLEIDRIIPVKQIPKTTSGKIQRYKLKEMYQDGNYSGILKEIGTLNEEMGARRRKIPEKEMREQIARIWEEILNTKPVGYNDNFFDLGGKSSHAVRVKSKLEELLSCKLEDVALFKYPTINTLASYLSREEKETTTSIRASRLKRKKQKFEILYSGIGNGVTGMEIAVIGMAGRFPGAKNINEFWDNLKNGVESISFFSEEELIETGLDPILVKKPMYVKAKGVLEDCEYFDASFFGYIPAEAEMMDPQIRVFHECAWESLEDAGYGAASYDGGIGVYAGASPNHRWESQSLKENKNTSEEFVSVQINDKDFLATRISYKLNLKGPSFTLYTACSTSLVSVDLACQGLIAGRCDIALAGGVSIWLPKKSGYLFDEDMIFSIDGHNKAFDAKANGTLFSDGVGICVLKRLEDAIADRDNVYAVIKGSATNNDGKRKAGYSAPSLEGQAEVIGDAQIVAGVEPESISYIEAHGTGTVIGDPLEFEALKLAFNTQKRNYCGIGSVKTNVGHLNAAAGIAGLIKTILSIKYRFIPPSLHYQTPNPAIDFEESPFYVNTGLKKWKNDEFPLRAGVSSFGIGGTNAHVILEEAPVVVDSSKSRDWQLICSSAKTEASLDRGTENLLNFFKKNPGVNLADAAYTLKLGRKAFPYKRMTVCSCLKDAVEKFSSGSGDIETAVSVGEERPVVFMFSGQGAQYVNMGLELYKGEPAFRKSIDECFERLESITGYSMKCILYPVNNNELGEAEGKINQLFYTSPIKFIFDYSLAKLLISMGIKPHTMIGHSFGEYVAACLSGVFSLEDALTLAAFRGKLMQEMPDGAMTSITLPEDELKPLLNKKLSLAAVNTPSLCIVSGPKDEVEAFEKQIDKKGIEPLRLRVPRAGHSWMVESILEKFAGKLEQIKFNRPQVPYISGMTGEWINADEVAKPAYWLKHLRDTVKFSKGLKQLFNEQNYIFLEVGPGRGLSGFVNHHADKKEEHQAVDLLRNAKDNVNDVYFLLNKIGKLWLLGVKINWSDFYSRETRNRVALPTYSFEKQSYGITGGISRQEVLSSHASDGKAVDISDWFYIPSWKLSSFPETPELRTAIGSRWLIFESECGIGLHLMNRLKKDEQNVALVKEGEDFCKTGTGEYTVNPRIPSHYSLLLEALGKEHGIPDRIVHLWLVTGEEKEKNVVERLEKQLDLGFYSMLFLAQAIGENGFSDKMEIFVVSDNSVQLAGDTMISPGKATVLGVSKVIPKEYPNIGCRCIDISLPEKGTRREQRLIDRLIVEFNSESDDTSVAYRNYQRWVQAFEPYPIERLQHQASRLKEKGTYLITGGLGGIGLVIAEHLAQTVKARLILVGRSMFPAKENWGQWLTDHDKNDNTSRKIVKLKKIEALGSEILIFKADIADMKQIQNIVSHVLDTFGSIDGVLHCAGVISDGLIQLKTKEMVEPVFAPKLMGTLVLEESLKNVELDFFILFSSLSSVLGPAGQVSYSSANAFLDAFAYYKLSKDGTFAVSINWDVWKEVGMAVGLVAGLEGEQAEKKGGGGATGAYRDELLKAGILPLEGVEVFARILDTTFPRVAVATRRLDALFEQGDANKDKTPGDRLDVAVPSKRLQNRPNLNSSYVAARSKNEKILVNVWQNFFGIDKIGIQDDFFDLGGDSLQAANILNRIHKELNIRLSLNDFFDNPTIEKVAMSMAGINENKITPYSTIEKTEVKKYYPLSKAQKGIYSIQQIDPENNAYNESAVMKLEGVLEIDRIEETFKKLIERHESYRTSFKLIDESPVQEIHDEAAFTIQYTEAGNDGFDVLVRKFITPFDLSKAPLLRVALVKIAEERYLFIISIHHIIADGVSIAVIQRDFNRLYRGEALPPLKRQYKDYCAWQIESLQQETIKKQEQFWVDKFSGPLPILNIPTERPRPEIQSFSGQTIDFEINESLTKEIKAINNENGTTLYMTLSAFYFILLAKYTGQEDIIIGTPVAGRNHHQLSELVGVFINVLLMRNFPAPKKSFKEFFSELKQNTLNAFENQDYRFDDLVEILDVKRDRSRNPVYDVVFAMEMFQVSGFEIPNLKISPYHYDSGTCKTDLRLAAAESNGRISMRLTYATALFKPETATTMAKHYVDIITQAVENTAIKIQDIELGHHLVTVKPTALRDVADEFDF